MGEVQKGFRFKPGSRPFHSFLVTPLLFPAAVVRNAVILVLHLSRHANRSFLIAETLAFLFPHLLLFTTL